MRFVYVIVALKEGKLDYYAKFRNDRLSKPFDEGPTIFESYQEANGARSREQLNRYRSENGQGPQLEFQVLPVLVSSDKDIKKVKYLLSYEPESLVYESIQ